MALSKTHYVPASQFTNGATANITGCAWASGDKIIVFNWTGNTSQTMNAPTNANLTFTAVTAATFTAGSSECNFYTWEATAGSSQTGQTIVANRSSGAGIHGSIVHVVTGGPSATLANATAGNTEAAFSRTVTAGSVCLYAGADWNGVAAGRTITTGSGTATERVDASDGSTYACYSGDWVGVSAGTFSFGITSYTSWKVSHGFVEVLDGGGGGGSQSITLPLITNSSTLYAPTVAPGAVTVTLPHITNTSTLHAPTVTPGAVTIALPHQASTSALHAPTVTVGAVTIALPHIDSTATLYAPTVSQGSAPSQAISLPHITNSSTLYAPTITVGAVTVTLPHITNTSVLYAPIVSTGALVVGLPHIDSASVLYPPTITVGAVTIGLPHIASSSVLYAMTVSFPGAFAPGSVVFDIPARSRVRVVDDDRALTIPARSRAIKVRGDDRVLTPAAPSRLYDIGD